MDEKLRVIITTDSEIDDKCSMLRFLLYTNDFNVEALISVNSKWQKDGHGEIWIHEFIDEYAKIYPNLIKHDKDYPSPNYLHSKVIAGPVDRAPLYADAPPYRKEYAAEFIIEKLLDNNPSPIYISMWGGGTLVANVFWILKNCYSNEDYLKAVEKARLYFIDYQEFGTGGGQWLRENLPEVHNVLDHQFHEVYNYRPRLSQPYESYLGDEWLLENVKNNHGPLGEMYYVMDNGLYMSEGDTPSFLWLVNNGLRSHECPSYGGWGGRHKNIGQNQWHDASDDENYKKPMWRWTPAVQNDWANRLDWCVMPYEKAKHPPVVNVKNGINQEVSPNQTVNLDASLSFDKDNREIQCKWWRYFDADTCSAEINIENCEDISSASFVVPNEIGKTIHIICEISHSDEQPITRYQRIIFEIK